MNSNNGIVAEFENRFGEKRVIHQTRHGLKVKRQGSTVVHKLNRTAAPLVGQRIKAARLAAGLTLAELCEKAGLASATPKSRMWEIENNVRKEGMRLGTLYAIAAALDVSICTLMPRVEEVLDACGAVDFEEQSPRLTVNS